jgi:taurine dioxygenase
VNRLMSWSIEGLDEAEGRSLLALLFDHLEQPHFIYSHQWRPGDLILWDNRCTQHARTDFSAQERRLMRRVVVQGDKPFRKRGDAVIGDVVMAEQFGVPAEA